MLTSRSTTSSSNISLERSIPQQTNYHARLTRTKETTIIKIKPSSNQNSSSVLPWHRSQMPRKETSWPSSTTTPQQDIRDEMKRSGKLPKSYHGQGCDNGSQTT